MDNVELKLVAIAVAALEDTEPSGYAPLEELGGGPRVLVERSDGRAFVVEAVADEAMAASLDAEHAAVSALESKGLPFGLPKRLATEDADSDSLGLPGPERAVRILVTEPLPGARISAEGLDTRDDLITNLARTLAAIHEAPVDAVLAAGLPSFDSAELHDRLVADVDRAAQSGAVPPALLERWEHEFETAGLWRFMPTVVHGRFTESDALVQDSEVVAITGWDGLKVADPAEDLAWVLSALGPGAVATFFSAYEQARRGADDGLRRRAELYSELSLLEWLLYGIDAGDDAIINDAEALLQELADMLIPEPTPQESEDDRTQEGTTTAEASTDDDSSPSSDARDERHP